jgi:preprotein translocase subunit SecE
VAKQTASTPQGKAATGSRSLRPRAAAGGGSRPSGGSDTIARRASRISVANYVEQSWAELKKVTWPTRQETFNLTIAVIVMTVAIAAFLGLIDAGLDKLVQVLIG